MRKLFKPKGYTLIEMILSIGILMILIMVMTNIFGQIVDVQTESKQISSVDQNGRYIVARLVHDFQSASFVASPSATGFSADILKLRINSIDYTYSVSPSGNLILTNQNGVDVINASNATISNFSVTRIGAGNIYDTVRVGFTVTSRDVKVSGQEQKSFQTTLGLQ